MHTYVDAHTNVVAAAFVAAVTVVAAVRFQARFDPGFGGPGPQGGAAGMYSLPTYGSEVGGGHGLR